MPVVKVMRGRQVVIPKELFEELHLEVGDYLEVVNRNGKLVYVPKQLVDRDAWYWSEEGQRVIGQARADIKAGKGLGPFDNADEAIAALKKAKP